MASASLAALFAARPFLLAPMAGVSDAAYRIVCRRHGAALAYSEMVSAAGIIHGGAKTWELVVPDAEEPQLCVQLFGSDPSQFAFAADAVQRRLGERLTLIDINMACPVRKVVGKGEGAALMETPERAEAIMRSCIEVARVPVSAKLRCGMRAGQRCAPELAARLEQAGAAAVAVHGRYASQLYRGDADWSIIDEVAERVDIPVIGSGDVFSAADAVAMLRSTAASAVFIARGTYGDPWIFEDAAALLASGSAAPVRGARERLAALREHLALSSARTCRLARARTFANWYLKGMPHAALWRARIVRCSTLEEFSALIDEIETCSLDDDAVESDMADVR